MKLSTKHLDQQTRFTHHHLDHFHNHCWKLYRAMIELSESLTPRAWYRHYISPLSPLKYQNAFKIRLTSSGEPSPYIRWSLIEYDKSMRTIADTSNVTPCLNPPPLRSGEHGFHIAFSPRCMYVSLLRPILELLNDNALRTASQFHQFCLTWTVDIIPAKCFPQRAGWARIWNLHQ